MRVFNEKFVQQICAKYEKRSEYNRPFFYFVATDDDYQSLRTEIEDLTADLPQAAQAKVIHSLQCPKSFMQTYHELVAGNLFKRLGYHIEYEKTINGLSPDWYVHPKEKMLAYIVEVFTDYISDNNRSEQGQVSDLHGRLQQITVGVVLHISYDNEYEKEVVLNPKNNKEIIASVTHWLIKTSCRRTIICRWDNF